MRGGRDREGEAQGEGLTVELEQKGLAGNSVNRTQSNQQDGKRWDQPMMLSFTSLCSETRNGALSPFCALHTSYTINSTCGFVWKLD